ncbi:spore coat protein [Amphibacillus sp. MSJ-3]|uniref:CotY/CotZ family spore coat protein n=1 Tax=Amphibacillus sp. MSJ-3 TaxID=2841505 RepID=UPI001C0EB8F1|nr:CotY/CotZ family spore coat protein [Amphibacillus sp. MSJ-3]MBU5595200.1 spore coat protein [Amphibacillus sp. MSJ-3]
MTCGSKFKSGNCVADILREIADAQNNIANDCCDSSCEQSIANLLGETPVPTNLDTVPVLLYCKDCGPFKGYGAPIDNIGNVIGSFYFRVKKVDKDNCAILELLRDPSDSNTDPTSPVEQNTGNLEATDICITVNVDCFCHITCLPAISAL